MMYKVISKIVRKLGFRYRLKWLNDKYYLKLVFFDQLGYKLDLKNPKTFNEKLQWLKLYNRQVQYTSMVDKYMVKKIVGSLIGDEYIIPTIGIWRNANEINFDTLPNQFVLKCTHDSGCVIICKDKSKFNAIDARKRLEERKKKNFFYGGREWPYKNVRPAIIAEQFMQNDSGSDLRDYKFFCFNGNVRFFKVDFDRFVDHHANYYDLSGKLLNFGEADYLPKYDANIELPKTINKMIELAEKLSVDIPFVRIDFYDVNGKIFFGEMTFFPASGFGKFVPEETDAKLGDKLVLPYR